MINPWRVVADREIQYKLHDKTFLLSTALLLVIVVGALLIAALMGGSTSTVAVVDNNAAAVVQRAEQGGADLKPEKLSDSKAAENAVSTGAVDVALLATADGYEVIGDTSVDAGMRESLAGAAASLQLQKNAATANVDLKQLLSGSQVAERALDPAPFPPGITYALTFGFAFLFYITAISFGMVLAQSVVQEKETRIVEMLVAAIPIRALLALGQIVVLSGNDTAVSIASYVPIASSFATPIRMVSEDVPLWQPLASALIVILAAAALVLLAARIYERSLLKTDRKATYRELLSG